MRHNDMLKYQNSFFLKIIISLPVFGHGKNSETRWRAHHPALQKKWNKSFNVHQYSGVQIYQSTWINLRNAELFLPQETKQNINFLMVMKSGNGCSELNEGWSESCCFCSLLS